MQKIKAIVMTFIPLVLCSSVYYVSYHATFQEHLSLPVNQAKFNRWISIDILMSEFQDIVHYYCASYNRYFNIKYTSGNIIS